MNKDSLLGLDPKRIGRLFGITFDSHTQDIAGPDDSTSGLLQACLAATASAETEGTGSWPGVIATLQEDPGFDPGRSLGDVLMDPTSDLDAVRKIRRYAKRRASREDSEAERNVATTIYFAAIASALLFHGVKITTYPYETLEASFNKLIAKRWMPAELAQFFVKAREACRRMQR